MHCMQKGGGRGVLLLLPEQERSFAGSSLQIECGRDPGLWLYRRSHVDHRTYCAHEAGAKARFYIIKRLSARLKSCPDTKSSPKPPRIHRRTRRTAIFVLILCYWRSQEPSLIGLFSRSFRIRGNTPGIDEAAPIFLSNIPGIRD